MTVNICRAMGCTKDPDVFLREEEFTPATFNDPELSAAAAGVLSRVVGSDHIQKARSSMAGEDFGRYGRHLEVPSFMFWLGSVERKRFEESQGPNGTPLPPLHSSTYAPDPLVTITTGVRCMSSLALAILEDKK